VDFNNEYLIHSSVLIDKVMDYVFYLTVSQDEKTQNDLYLKAVDNVLKRVNDDQLKKSFIQALLQSFAKDENIVLSDYLFDNYYNKLPIGLQNENYRAGLQQELKTAVGRDAPPIEWEEKGEKKSLSELEGYENYIVVFWSTSCPHCMREMPKFYEYIKDNEKVKVIMVSLETEESQGTWKSETYYYPEFSHVLALQKWENPMVRSYNVHATPSYFVLDADKRIIDKPYELLDLEVFFKDLKRKQDKK
jgi:thiol-disulfide isomerase/thioredoxin